MLLHSSSTRRCFAMPRPRCACLTILRSVGGGFSEIHRLRFHPCFCWLLVMPNLWEAATVPVRRDDGLPDKRATAPAHGRKYPRRAGLRRRGIPFPWLAEQARRFPLGE